MANLAESGLVKLCASYIGPGGELQVTVRVMTRADLAAILERIDEVSHG